MEDPREDTPLLPDPLLVSEGWFRGDTDGIGRVCEGDARGGAA